MADPEKQVQVGDVTSEPSVHEASWNQHEAPKSRGFFKDFWDGFKPAQLENIDTKGMSEAEIAGLLTARQPLKRKLRNRHIQMIAIGGSIGTGLFIGSGGSFAQGGPAGVVICFCIIGMMIFCMMQALGELAVCFPVSGSFSVYSTRFIDPSWGFAMGWNYCMQWLVVYPLELISGALVLGYWDTDNNGATNVNKAAWVALFYFVISAINVFGVKGYGEAEFLFAIIKVIAVIGFCIYGVIAAAGGPPKWNYYGAHYWYDPGAFAHGFKGVVAAFINAAFSFAGTELAGLASAETANPAKSLPRAIKQVFWRIVLFYIVSLTIVSMLIQYDDPAFAQANPDGRSSPFVIALQNTGVNALPSIFNAVIIVAVLSVANSSVYGCSRTLCALGAQGYGPRWLAYIDREGRPLFATIATLIFGLLCFLAATPKENVIFNWLLALSSLSSVFTWGSVCWAHIRFRRAMKVQGRSLDELGFKAALGIWGSWFGFIINFLIICLEFWIALFPFGSKPNASDFFSVYLTIPVVLAFYLFHKIWKRRWHWNELFVRAKDMDLNTGRRNLDIEQVKAEIREEREYIDSRNFLYRQWRFWC